MKRKLLLLTAAILCAVGMWGSQTPTENGVYYIQNVETGLFLSRGASFGTHAVLDYSGLAWRLSGASGSMKLQMYDIYLEGDKSQGMGDNSYTDNGLPISNWTLDGDATSGYTIKTGDTYLTASGNTVGSDVVVDGDGTGNKTWKFLTAEQHAAVLAAKKSTQEAAIATSASYTLGESSLSDFVGNTYLWKTSNVDVARPTSSGVWTFTQNRDQGGANNFGDYGTEIYNMSGSFSKTITGLDNGIYKLTVKAMHRSTHNAPCWTVGQTFPSHTNSYVLANGIYAQLKDWKSAATFDGNNYVPNGTSEFKTKVEAGEYATDVFVYVSNGNLDIKVSQEGFWYGGWFAFYGVTLTKYTPKTLSEVTESASFTSGNSATADTWYAFTVSSDGYYKITSTDASTISYSQIGTDLALGSFASFDLRANGYNVLKLTNGTYYFKSSATSTITIATLADGDVVTDVFITNPSFETGDKTGWTDTNSSFSIVNDENLSNKDGDNYAYAFLNTTQSLTQNTSALVAGKYVLSVNARIAGYNGNIGTATIGLGGNTTPIRGGGDAATYYVAYEAAANATPSIGFSRTGAYTYNYFDNFTLTYYSTLPDVSISDLTSCAMDADVRAALTSASTTYSGSKTAANYNALQTAIINAKNSIAKYSTTANSNWTGLIKNPSFEGTGSGSTDGWSFTGSDDSDARSNGNATYTMTNVDGDYLFNIWATGNTISQTLGNMPAGTYKLTAVMGTDAGKTFYLKMGGQTGYAESSEDGKGVGVTVTVYAKLAAQGDLTISADAGGSQWYKVDNFQLTYNPTLPASLTKISGPMNGTISSTQDTKVNAYNATSGQTIDNLIDAQEAMLAAYESKLVYNDITTIKNSYDTKASNLDAAGQAAYTTATTTAETGATTKYNAGSYTTAAQAETAYLADYVTAVKAQGDNSDMTDAIVNPSFETGNYTGWTYNSNNGGSHTPLIKNGGFGTNGGNYKFNYWVQNTGKATITQTVSSMPAGHYRLTVYYQTANGAKFSLKANNTGVEEDTNGDLTMATTDFTLASPGNISIEVKFTASWIDLDNFRLTYYDSDVYENREAIIDNNGDITSLIHDNDFQAGVTDWDGGYHCNWVKDRSWRGTSYVNNHYEKNANGAMTYTVSNMPAGTYKVIAAARAAAGCTIQPEIASTTGTSLTGIGDDRNANSTTEINTDGVEMPYSDLAGFTTQGSAHNWKWITATGTLASAGDLVINFNCTGTDWMAIDDVHLYCTNLDGTSYTYTVDDDHLDAGDKVVTADIILSNPNTIVTSDAAINGAAGTQINNNLVSGTIANMVLYDGNAYTSPDDAYAITAATYYRNIAADAKATLMLPFALDATSKAKGTAYAPTRFANDNVSFTSVENPAADVPYVFVPSGDAVTTLTGSRSSAEEGTKQVEGTNVTLYGTYASTTITPNANNYIASQGKLWLVDNTQNSNPFRAYLNVTTPSPVKALTFSFDNETAVSTVEAETGKATIYNLAGQRVNKAQKGLYIVNGKKTYIK